MTKLSSLLILFALSSMACADAQARKIAAPVVSQQQSPYRIELVAGNGNLLDTYQHRGRFYVEGNSGSRYSIRITNPTNLRVEAVVSVDGLDVIDGETANFNSKRGYIVPAHGSLVIDGFRVSTQSVAAFRFSSVSSSYAGLKGKARNVGVVGVAIFAERERPQIISAAPRPHYRAEHSKLNRRGSTASVEAEAPSMDFDSDDGAGGSISRSGKVYERPARRRVAKKEERSGLGTAFGEHRHSAVSFTQFQRASQRTPTSFAELRYNSGPGLQALGIRLRRTLVSPGEVALRESASAFPNSRFAQPPR